MEWIKLHHGTNHLLYSVRTWIDEGPLYALIEPWIKYSPDAPTPLDPSDKKYLDILANGLEKRSLYPDPLSEEHKEALGTALRDLRKVFSISVKDPEISIVSVTLAWPCMITLSFIKLVEERVPEALVLVAHYCVLLKRIETLWWMTGKAENLLETVRAALGGGWDEWIQWPIDKVGGREILS